MEDFQIIQAVLKGDREAYAELIRAHHARILSLCLSMLLDRSEADDAAQEVFVKAFASLYQYKQDLSFQAWLYRIASNHCLDLLRKKKRQKTDSLDSLLEQKGDHLEDLAARTADLGRRIEEKEEKVQLALRVLSYVSPEQRQILILRELDGLSYEEISAVLHCSLDAVKARLKRARQQLQEKARHFLEQRSFR